MANLADYPLLKRISHWVNLINFLMLGITGYLIHSPWTGMPMNLVRNLHFFFMYFLIINGLVRFYYAFLGKRRDFKNFALNKEDLKNAIPQLKYYLFLGKHPKTKQLYNPLQKTAYLAFPLLALVQIVTGFILYRPSVFLGLADSFGGLAAVRGVHYVTMWLFFALILAHVYLVFTESRTHFWAMFFGKNKEEKTIDKKLEKAA